MLESFRKTLQAYTAGTSSTQDASQPHGTTEGDPASISVSAVAAQFNSLRLQERHEIPGAFPPTWDGDAPQVYDIYAQSSGLPDNSLETYLTAATLTATSLDTRAHNRVFSSSSAFYERSISSLPDSLASLGISDATDALEAVAMAPIPPRSPAFPTGHQFGRATFSDHLNPSPKASDAASKIPPLPPASRPGRQFGRAPVSNNLVDLSPIEIPMSKTETDAMKDLARTRGKVDHHQRQVLGDDFPSLSADTQHTRVHEAKAFATERLGHVEQLSRNAKRRRLDAATRKACQTADDPSHIETECKKVIELLRGFLMKVHAITALLPESGRPLFIDSGKFTHRFWNFSY
ncbi:hypothetical protein L218DRAFT_994458 [Marasmius fiardii PR-910]|nr:hypothetical protein L218DRAFT_994458 [Marasmius fiardii PR-910]